MVSLRPGTTVKRILIATLRAAHRAIHDARVKALRIGRTAVHTAPALLKRTSVVQALRLAPKISTKARNVSNLCIENKGSSRGLFLISNGPICRIGRVNNFFSTFGGRTVGNVGFFGTNFPTHCNKHLSSIISIRAGRKGVGRCRKSTSLKLISNGLGLRKPV